MGTASMSKRARLDFGPMVFLYTLSLNLLPKKIDITCIKLLKKLGFRDYEIPQLHIL